MRNYNLPSKTAISFHVAREPLVGMPGVEITFHDCDQFYSLWLPACFGSGGKIVETLRKMADDLEADLLALDAESDGDGELII